MLDDTAAIEPAKETSLPASRNIRNDTHRNSTACEVLIRTRKYESVLPPPLPCVTIMHAK